MFKTITIIFAVLLLFACSSQNKSKPVDCPIPGKLIHWQADYCLWEHETDDFHNELVQKCFFNRTAIDDNSSETDCEKKRFYKQKYCEKLIDIGSFEGTITECLSSKTVIPNSVRNNGVGE